MNRALARIRARQQANAALLRLPLVEYLALTRKQRHQLLTAARRKDKP